MKYVRIPESIENRRGYIDIAVLMTVSVPVCHYEYADTEGVPFEDIEDSCVHNIQLELEKGDLLIHLMNINEAQGASIRYDEISVSVNRR